MAEEYLPILGYITEEWFKDRIIPFVVSKDSKGDVTNISNFNLRNLFFVPLMGRQWRTVVPAIKNQ